MTDKMKEAEELFWFHAKRVGLDIQYEFRWMHRRSKFSRAGQHHRSHKRIELQPTFVELNSKHLVEQTILHELAHALLPPNCGHNDLWKRKAIELGHSGETYYSNEVNRGQ